MLSTCAFRLFPECYDFADDKEKKEIEAFLEFQSFLMKPWDGPAAVVFTAGDTVGAHLDRNGLRPLRYTITEDGFLVLGSETGMADTGKRPIKEKGRLGPGGTISVDTRTGKVKFTRELLRDLSRHKPYGQWIENSLVKMNQAGVGSPDPWLILSGSRSHSVIPLKRFRHLSRKWHSQGRR